MPRDPVKARQRKWRYVNRKHIERFGPGAGDMRGRHGNHAAGPANGRWNTGRLITSHGYVAVRVAADHPHAWGVGSVKYAYEHVIVMTEHIGRPLAADEVVHHRNGDKTDNRIDNLELLTNAEHAREHIARRERDAVGRLTPARKTTR